MTTITGTEVIRRALRTRGLKTNTATLAQDLQVSSHLLDNFLAGKHGLPAETLTALARTLWGDHVEYVPSIDRLRPTNKAEPVSMGIHPPRYQSSPASYEVGTLSQPAHRPVKPEKPVPKVARPGWLD